MSSAVPNDFFSAQPSAARVFFWIRPVDEKGLKVSPAFAEAAYSKAQELRLYRWRDLTDEAIRAELVEKAVYKASRAQCQAPIDDPAAYVLTTFARLVDRHISREIARNQMADLELPQLQRVGILPKSVNPDDVDDSILQKQLVKAIPSEEDRLCWQWRLAGYEVQEIATALNISADCLSTRMRRAAKEAARILNLGRKRQ